MEGNGRANGARDRQGVREPDLKGDQISGHQEMHAQPNRVYEEREQIRKEIRTENQVRRFFGRVASVLGILVALAGLLTPGDVGLAGPVGILMGSLGYALGAHRLGTAAVILSGVEILLGALTS